MDKKEVDDFIHDLQSGKQINIYYDGKSEPERNDDVFDMLNQLLIFLKERKDASKLSANVINATVRTTKKFLRFSKVKIDNEEFQDRVQLLRKEKPTKQGIEKTDIVKLLNACKNIRLKTALHGFAAKGPRPIELCAVRNRDVNLDAKVPSITFRAEYSKMREAKTRPLTREEANQYRIWKKWKYRERRTSIYSEKEGKWIQGLVTPKERPDDLFFAHVRHNDESEITPEGLYGSLQTEFAELVDLVYNNKDMRNASNGRARSISLKTFRDFVKSTISDAGHQDFSEYWIGHSGSTYYQKSERERMEIFRKIEPYLTYTDITALEAKGADVAAKLEDRDRQIQSLIKKQEQLETLIQSLIDSGQLKSHSSPPAS
jgi:integrase